MPIAMRPMAVLLSCIILFLTACPSVPTSSTPSDPVSVPAEGDSAGKADNLREALALSGRKVAESLNPGASVAVISITAPDSFEGDYALEELTLLVRAQKFRVVDRRNMDVIQAEQRFQLSGEVDDETAVFGFTLTPGLVLVERSRLDAVRAEQNLLRQGLLDTDAAIEVGKLLGAQYMITGQVIPMSAQAIIFARVIHVQTGEIVSAAQIFVERSLLGDLL